MIAFPKAAKPIVLHNNEGFDTEGFIADMRAKGINDEEIASTMSSGTFSSIWSVIMFQILFVVVLFLIVVTGYFVIVEAKALHALNRVNRTY